MAREWIRRIGVYLGRIRGIGPMELIILKIGKFLEEVGEIEPIKFTKWLFVGCGGCGSRIVGSLAESKKLKDYAVSYICIDSSEYTLSVLPRSVKKFQIGEPHGFGGNLERSMSFYRDFFRERGEKYYSFVEEFKRRVKDANVIFLITSSGGATGACLIPFIVNIVKKEFKKNIPIIALTIMPFSHENIFIFYNSSVSIPMISSSVDTLIAVENASLEKIVGKSDINSINKFIINILEEICYPKKYPYGKILDVSDFAFHKPHSILVPSFIRYPSLIRLLPRENEKELTEYIFKLREHIFKNTLVRIDEEQIRSALINFYYTKEIAMKINEMKINKDFLMDMISEAIRKPEINIFVNFIRPLKKEFGIIIFFETSYNFFFKKLESKLQEISLKDATRYREIKYHLDEAKKNISENSYEDAINEIEYIKKNLT